MMNQQRRNDNIFGLSIIILTFMAGFFTSSFLSSTLTTQSSNQSLTENSCSRGHLCFPINDEIQFVIDTDDYLLLIDDEIQGIGYDNLMLRRRSVPVPGELLDSPTEQLFLDFYLEDRLIKTITPLLNYG